MADFNIIVTLLGGTIVLLGLGSGRLAASPFPPTLLALLVGVAAGPQGFNWINLDDASDKWLFLERAARMTLAVGLVGIALRVPATFSRRNIRAMLVLVGLGIPLMWIITSLLVCLVLGLPFWLAAIIGGAAAPTDPLAATPIVTGKLARENVPPWIRHAISLDSGVNDGIAYPLVFLPFLMLMMPAHEAVFRWLTWTLLWEVGAATLAGGLIGWACGRLLRWSAHAEAIKSEWRLVYTAALGLFAVGAGKLIHSDEVLVVFVAAFTFDQVVSASSRKNEEVGQEAINRFFAIPIFVLLGSAIPWSGWMDLGWSGLLLCAAVLLLRRPVALLLLRPLLPELRSLPDLLFTGWFGPIAVGAVYYASLMESRLETEVIWNVVSLLACSSIIVHGMTAAWLTRLYGATIRGNEPDRSQ